MSTTLQRTQIYFPSDLRADIERLRRLSGESMGEYVRKATKERIQKEKRRKTDLKIFAKDLFASLTPSKTKKEVDIVAQEIRKEREEEDKHWMKRWNEAISVTRRKKS